MSINNQLFLSHINSADELTMILRSYQDFDLLMAELINEALVESHFLDVERIPFSLRVELGIALGKIGMEMRSPLLKFNAIRNEFAHDSGTKLTEKHVRDLYNVFDDPRIRSMVRRPYESFPDPISLFRELISILFVLLRSSVERVRDQKLLDLALHEEILELLADSPVRDKDKPFQLETDASIKKRFERLKKERAEREE